MLTLRAFAYYIIKMKKDKVVNKFKKGEIVKSLLFSLLLSSSMFLNAETIHLYGGTSHEDYLGCINCSEFDSNSI